MFGRLDRSLLRGINKEFEKASTNSVYYRGGGGGASFTDEYQAVLDYATLKGYTLPNEAGKIADNALIIAAKANDLWNNSQRFYNHHTAGGSDYACIDYKNPSDSTLALKINSPSYSTKTGFTGNGSSSYLNYQFVPSTDGGSLYTLNDASVICYNNVNAVGNYVLYGSGTNAPVRVQLNPRYTGNVNYVLMNDSYLSTVASTDSSGLWRLKRDGTSVSLIRNGGLFRSHTVASISLSNFTFLGLCLNSNGTPIAFSPYRLDNMIIGKGSVVNDSDINIMWNNHIINVAAA